MRGRRKRLFSPPLITDIAKGRGQRAFMKEFLPSCLSAFWRPRGSKGFKPPVRQRLHWLSFRRGENLIRERNIRAFCPLPCAFPSTTPNPAYWTVERGFLFFVLYTYAKDNSWAIAFRCACLACCRSWSRLSSGVSNCFLCWSYQNITTPVSR